MDTRRFTRFVVHLDSGGDLVVDVPAVPLTTEQQDEIGNELHELAQTIRSAGRRAVESVPSRAGMPNVWTEADVYFPNTIWVVSHVPGNRGVLASTDWAWLKDSFGHVAEYERVERTFPIQQGPAIPWSLIAPHARQAERNHAQSLERLAERGGLDPCEAVCVLRDHQYHCMTLEQGREVLAQIVRDYRAVPSLNRLRDALGVNGDTTVDEMVDKIRSLRKGSSTP